MYEAKHYRRMPSSLFVAASAEHDETAPEVETADAIVVGAGMSGLSAASRLREALCGTGGIKVVMLEGRNRVGGRTHTARMGKDKDKRVDVGGMWLQYPDENPVTTYLPGVEQFETPTDSVRFYTDDDNDNAGGGGVARELGADEMGEMAGIMERWRAAARAAQVDAPADASAVDVVPNLGQEAIESASGMEKVAAMVMRSTTENYLASSAEEITGIGVWEDGLVPPQNILRDGFEVAYNKLAEGVDVRLSHAVNKIEVKGGGGKGVRITTECGKVLEATMAIVTLPLGVLKAGTVEFVPPLPEKKRRAIRRIGFGVLDKVALRFEETFWPADKDFLVYATEDRSLVSVFLNFAASLGDPILVGFHQGQAALENEKLSDNELAEKAMVCLRRMYGDDIPDPEEVHCTRWGTDRFSMGAYTAPSIRDDDSSMLEDLVEMAKPVGTDLYFAGETTALQVGLIHGAYNSGIRAAEEAIRDGLQDFEPSM